MDERHGGPYDRGRADAFYQRGRNPHYYKGGTYISDRVEESEMTAKEIEEYNTGFDEGRCENPSIVLELTGEMD